MTFNNTPVVKAPIPLVAPVIPKALEDGLIPIEHLTAPIAINFPVWPAAQPGYTYQLRYDGLPASAEKIILETDKPGDILLLEIPVHLLTEGNHSVSYRTYSPTTAVEDFSAPTAIRIDRTAPGAPDLAPIIFPSTIQDGLTSDELTSMNDVLAARIASYNGMQAGDVIRTYWGSIEGPQVFVDANDMGLKRVIVDFSREFLELVGDGQQDVYYTVTDLAGNLSMESEVITVELKLSEILPLPLPTILEADNDTLDPADTLNGATVVIGSSANLRVGDQVKVSWKGAKGSDEKEKVVAPDNAGKALSVVFSSALVNVNEGERVSVNYSVTRANGAVQTSEVFSVQVKTTLRELPAPTMDTVGPDGAVKPGLITETGATVRVDFDDLSSGDMVKVIWVGASRYETPEQTASGSTGLVFNVPKALILATQNARASVTYQVTRAGAIRESLKLKLSVLSTLTFNTSPLTLSGKTYVLTSRPDVTHKWMPDNSAQRVAKEGVRPYTYSSSNPAIAQVQGDGVVWSRGNGKATISVTDATGASLSYPITVSGVIQCVSLPKGKFDEVNAAAASQHVRLPSIQELREIHAAYNSRWPLDRLDHWSSTVAKPITPFGKTYYVKNPHTGREIDAYTYSHLPAVGLR